MTGRKFIFRVASDSDCEKEHSRIRLWRDRTLVRLRPAACRPGRGADRVPGQHAARQPRARVDRGQHAGRAAAPQRAAGAARTSTCCGSGNLRALKRPELVLELARQLPDVQLHAGGRTDAPGLGAGTYFDDVKAAAARLPNVYDARRACVTRTPARWFDRAKIFLNTSSIEGFPEHLPAGLDPRRAGGELLRSRRSDPPPAARRRVPRRIDDMREGDPRAARRRRLSRKHRAPRARLRGARIHQRRRGALPRTTRNKDRVRVRVRAADGGIVP